MRIEAFRWMRLQPRGAKTACKKMNINFYCTRLNEVYDNVMFVYMSCSPWLAIYRVIFTCNNNLLRKQNIILKGRRCIMYLFYWFFDIVRSRYHGADFRKVLEASWNFPAHLLQTKNPRSHHAIRTKNEPYDLYGTCFMRRATVGFFCAKQGCGRTK